ncbi:DUF4333 domain-containing protein [Nonomuraea antimicrobica]|uniref:DUF4333 domain-containing protein n=1 Tax=Nonomuraea antimicrobica TaxID=561173 RepID=UPI003CD0A5D6
MQPAVALPRQADESVTTWGAARVGQRPKTVLCPGDLEATAGASLRCQLEADDGTRFGLRATVKSAEGQPVKFDIKVDDRPATGS